METEHDKELEQSIIDATVQVEEALEDMQFSVGLTAIWKLISRTNKYIDETEPWVLAKDETQKDRLGNVMAHLSESIRKTAVMLQPFLTEAPVEIFRQLNITEDALMAWDSVYTNGQIKPGTLVQKGGPIFPRLEVEKEVETIKAMMQNPAKEEEKAKKVETPAQK